MIDIMRRIYDCDIEKQVKEFSKHLFFARMSRDYYEYIKLTDDTQRIAFLMDKFGRNRTEVWEKAGKET